MADNNYIEIVARLNMATSGEEIQKQLNELAKKLSLQLDNVTINPNGLNALQTSIDTIQKKLKVNISSVGLDQNKIIQETQQITQQISSSMSGALNKVDTSGLSRATDYIKEIQESLNKGNGGKRLSFTNLDELQSFVRNALPQFENIRVSINSWKQGAKEATGQVKGFTAEILNGDKAVEKLSFHLSGKGKNWSFGNATSTDNAIKLQEQLEKQLIKSENAGIKLGNSLIGVKRRFDEILQAHSGDTELTNYLTKANEAIAKLNGADSKNFERLKIEAQEAIKQYTDYLNKLKSADTKVEQSQRRLASEISSGYKTLTHYVQMMNNLSQRQVFNKNASAENVIGWQGDIAKQNEQFEKLRATINSGVVTPEVLNKIKELSNAINTVILDGHKMARTLGQSTSNVNAEAELNNLKTLMNNLKASDVEVEKLKADYGELIGLFTQAKETGDYTKFFTQLETFKSKFTEAKSEVRATNAAISDLEKMAKSLSSNKMNSFFDANSGNVQANALKTEIVGLINEWATLNQEIQNTGRITPSMQTRLDELRVKMQNATSAADALQQNIKEIANSQKLATQRQSLDTRITSWLQNNTRASQETRQALMRLQQQIQNADKQTMTNLNNQFREVTANARAAGEAGMKLGDVIKQKLSKFAGWFSIATVVMRSVNELKNMYREVVELDTALVDLRKTTNGTNAELEQFYIDANKIGKDLGVTTKEVIQAASSWSRLGYSLKDAQEMAKTSSIFASISPDMGIDEATDGLVSAMKAFNIEANDALDGIASKVNIIGNTQAVSNENIVEFLTRSSAAMAEANNSLEETIALGTAITEITRDATNAGQVMKTMSMRIRGIDEETEEYSEDIAMLTGKIADLTKTAKTPGGISLFTDATRSTYKSTVQILREIGGIYDDLTDKQQAELLEILGGKRNGQAVAAALNNFGTVEKSLDSMANSAGNAEAEMSVITDSIEYKTNRLKETAVGIAQDIFQRDSTKQMVDNLTSLLEIINSLTKSIGGLGTAFTAFMAYKGLRGQGIFDIFRTGATSIWGGVKNFFTQPILSQKGIDLGLTQDSIQRLNQYNNLIKQNVSITSAYHQTMRGADDATKLAARSIANGSVQMNELTIASKAAAIGMNMLNAAMNIGVTLVVSYGITQLVKKMDELIVTEEEAKQQHDELVQSIKSNIAQHNAEQKEIQSLLAEYKSYGEYTSYTAEQKEQLKSIQEQLIDTYGLEAEGIDLVNGKYEEQNKLLDENARKKAKENNANLWAAYEETKSDYDKNSGYSFKQIFKANSIGTKGKGLFAEDVYEESALKKAFSDVFEETTKITGLSYNNMAKTSSIQTQEITFALRTVDEDGKPLDANAMLEQVLAIQDRIDEIRRDSSQQSLTQSAEFIALQEQVAKWTEHYRKEVNENNTTLTDLAKNLALTTAVNIDGVDYYADTVTSDIYNEFSKKLIEAYSKTNPEVADAIRKYLSDYYDEWVNAFENMSDAEKAWYAQQQQIFKDTKSFAFEDYKEQIEEVEKAYSTLSSLYEKLTDEEKELSVSDLGSALKEFPELAPYVSDTDELIKKVKELNKEKVTSLIGSFVELKKSISDPTQLEQLDGWINYLQKMLNLQKTVKKELANISASDYTKYEEENVQKIIDKLEKEKDAQNDILDSLKEQKEQLEEIISNYEKAADVVGKYIDRSQIQPLEDHKSEVEEYYNTQIDKLKETNDELDRNIELQKAQDALTNARKNKVHVYSETQGWHYEANTTAIQQAEKDLAELQNNYAIEDLEKQRDKEVKEIENQIKAWEDYKDQWKQQVEQITEADEELIASKILGSDWREKVANKDVDTMTNFSIEYAGYNNRLKNQVNIEISNLERAIKARENEIEDWKDYKSQLATINEEITNSNNEYLGDLNQFVIDENSTLEQRIEHLKQYAKTVKELNENNPNEINDDVDIDNALQGTGWYGIERDGTILKLYSSEAEAEQDKERIIKNLVKKQIAPGMPSNIIDTITQRIIDSLKITKYAYGGVNSHTGLSWLDGTKNNSEVVFNSAQAKQLYDLVKNGDYGKMIRDNILDKFGNNQLLSVLGNRGQQQTTQNLTISFPNATIEAKDYDSFKGFMDRYTNDLLLKMQVGL